MAPRPSNAARRGGVDHSSSYPNTVHFVDQPRQVLSPDRNVIQGQSMAEYGASRQPRFSVSAAATTPVPAMTATTVHPSMTYGGGLQQIEQTQVKQSTAKRHSLASQYDPEAATPMQVNQRHGKRSELSTLGAKTYCDAEPVFTAVGEYVDQ
ncbi:hypothetical protein FRC01_007580, partial [Tulasnella sp. 417]